MPKYHRLESLRVEKPCPKQWEQMEGNDRSRFCEHCRKSVHNLSDMTAWEAEQFLKSSAPACVRFESDSSGAPLFRVAGLAAATVALTSLSGCGVIEVATVGETSAPPPVTTKGPEWTIGTVAVTKSGGRTTIGELPQQK